ncbi:MAG: glycosyltransferase [Candidatus Coatesbacteria bacterium]|nr:MAG: glycosyltransferase [Candidatus Coatesbacteria bacterium]
MGKLNNLAMLSVHGYVDAVPVLGATDTGGQVTYVLELAKGLAKLGVTVDLYTRRFDDREPLETVADGVRIVRVPCGPPEFVRKEDMLQYLPEYVDNMYGFIESEGLEYQLMHSHYWDAGFAAMELAPRLGIPFIHTSHSLGAWKRERMGGDPDEMERLFRFEERIATERLIFSAAAALTATTPEGVANYERLYGFESDDMIVIPPGVDVHRFNPEPQPGETAPAYASDDFVFALSRIDSNKGLDYLLFAFDKVRGESDAKLVVGGGSKNPKQHELDVLAALNSIIDELGLKATVTFAGYVPDEELAPYYRRAKAFVLPSKFEPFGMTALEAMACGTPVVATNLGGIKHNLDDGVNALLVDPSDTHELSGAILTILNNPIAAEKLSKAGLKKIRDEFAWEVIARRNLGFFKGYIS